MKCGVAMENHMPTNTVLVAMPPIATCAYIDFVAIVDNVTGHSGGTVCLFLAIGPFSYCGAVILIKFLQNSLQLFPNFDARMLLNCTSLHFCYLRTGCRTPVAMFHSVHGAR